MLNSKLVEVFVPRYQPVISVSEMLMGCVLLRIQPFNWSVARLQRSQQWLVLHVCVFPVCVGWGKNDRHGTLHKWRASASGNHSEWQVRGAVYAWRNTCFLIFSFRAKDLFPGLDWHQFCLACGGVSGIPALILEEVVIDYVLPRALMWPQSIYFPLNLILVIVKCTYGWVTEKCLHFIVNMPIKILIIGPCVSIITLK